MIAVLDESTPELTDGLLVYSLAMVILDEFVANSLRVVLAESFPRKNPFHWERDRGEPIRRRMLDELCATNIRVHLAAAIVPPRGQDAQRQRLIDTWLLPAAHHDGVNRLLIEQRSQHQNSIEKRSIRDWHRHHRVPMPEIEHVTKMEPLAWAADACAGLWSDYVLHRDDSPLIQLVRAHRIGLSYSQDHQL